MGMLRCAIELKVMMRSTPWNFRVVCASVPERSGDGIGDVGTLTLTASTSWCPCRLGP